MAKGLDRVELEIEREGEDVQDEEGENIEAAKELLEAIKENMKRHKGRKYEVR